MCCVVLIYIRLHICTHIQEQHCILVIGTKTLCNTLQHTATHCKTLHYTATHCNTLMQEQHCLLVNERKVVEGESIVQQEKLRYVQVCCSIVQCVAVCCSMCSRNVSGLSICVAVYCSVLQGASVCCSRKHSSMRKNQQRQADRQTDRQIDREADRQTDRQTDRHKYIDR